MGGLTNELAAFPSLHAGWALWVALVVRRTTTRPWARGLGWLHAGITAIVVVGTGNHWILDVCAGWALVIVAMWLVDPWFADSRQLVKRRRLEFRRRVLGSPPPAIESIPEDTAVPPLGDGSLSRGALADEPLTTEAFDAWADPSPERRYDC
jgi:hypothetical protein